MRSSRPPISTRHCTIGKSPNPAATMSMLWSNPSCRSTTPAPVRAMTRLTSCLMSISLPPFSAAHVSARCFTISRCPPLIAVKRSSAAAPLCQQPVGRLILPNFSRRYFATCIFPPVMADSRALEISFFWGLPLSAMYCTTGRCPFSAAAVSAVTSSDPDVAWSSVLPPSCSARYCTTGRCPALAANKRMALSLVAAREFNKVLRTSRPPS
mmetsp:Transcript_37020/g.92983  ORF Transcript_37020/g.92983 Transcript_37020/m.92983 type:complete len:211 (+) Transcript_37020:1100-1732(+)